MNARLCNLAAKWESNLLRIDSCEVTDTEAERLTDELLAIENQIAAEPAHNAYELNKKVMVLADYGGDDGTPERVMASIKADTNRLAVEE